MNRQAWLCPLNGCREGNFESLLSATGHGLVSQGSYKGKQRETGEHYTVQERENHNRWKGQTAKVDWWQQGRVGRLKRVRVKALLRKQVSQFLVSERNRKSWKSRWKGNWAGLMGSPSEEERKKENVCVSCKTGKTSVRVRSSRERKKAKSWTERQVKHSGVLNKLGSERVGF